MTLTLLVRSSLWLLTMLTIVRYMAVVCPLRLPTMITRQRVVWVATGLWGFILALALLPFSLDVGFKYSREISVCIWTLDERWSGTQVSIFSNNHYSFRAVL